jgi:hypothetical protein
MLDSTEDPGADRPGVESSTSRSIASSASIASRMHLALALVMVFDAEVDESLDDRVRFIMLSDADEPEDSSKDRLGERWTRGTRMGLCRKGVISNFPVTGTLFNDVVDVIPDDGGVAA